MATTKYASHPFDNAPAHIVARRYDGELVAFWSGTLGALRDVMADTRKMPCGWSGREQTRAALAQMLDDLMLPVSNDEPRSLSEVVVVGSFPGGRVELVVGVL